jgi:hypothetical protein
MVEPLLVDRVAVVTGAGQVFLASDVASYITGTVIEVGGGRYI